MKMMRLIVLSLFIQLISIAGIKAQSNKIVAFNKTDTVTLYQDEFKIAEGEAGLDLLVTNKSKLASIYELVDPCIKFYTEKGTFIARGLYVFSSSVPANADYFFPFFESKKIYASENDSIHFKKIHK